VCVCGGGGTRPSPANNDTKTYAAPTWLMSVRVKLEVKAKHSRLKKMIELSRVRSTNQPGRSGALAAHAGVSSGAVVFA
jgi:hypothetical protein